MTKKDYVKIAEELHDAFDVAIAAYNSGHQKYPDFWVAVSAIGRVLQKDNDNFDWNKFIDTVYGR